MRLSDIKDNLPQELFLAIEKEGFKDLRPSQEKAVRLGLLDKKSLLVCTPTASGKTLVAELAIGKVILESRQKAIYILPLKALASEKFKEFNNKYGKLFRIALSIGDIDSGDEYLSSFDLIICTAEKLDSLLRHRLSWLSQVGVIVVDEVHLINDPGRGPTLEILITILRKLLPGVQLIALSATVGNAKELADWLGASLVSDSWRPVKLHQGVHVDGHVDFS